MARQMSLPEPTSTRVRAMLAKALIQRAAGRLPFRIVVPAAQDNGMSHLGRPDEPVTLRLWRPESFYRRLGDAGLIGFGESFQAGDWDSDDLAGLLAVFAAGLDLLVPPALQRLRGHRAARQRPRDEAQTVEGARRNARHHYALPNELFLAMLDETMCYSCAIFPTDDHQRVIADEATLADAQRRKIDRLLDLVRVGAGTRVLDIGTGWGELPLRAARRGGIVHAVTNMSEHAEFARDRIAGAGLTERVRVDLCDYRQITSGSGGYDAIVSVEMIEVVGPEYWPAYFRTLERLLAPEGRIGLQAMTMPHHRMLKTSTTYTWIDKYIFPGGVIPSVPAIEQTLAQNTSLRVLDRYAFGDHYRTTLSLWRQRFNRNWPDLSDLGFDEIFRRTWNFYLAFCEAGFASGHLDVYQFLIGKGRPGSSTLNSPI